MNRREMLKAHAAAVAALAAGIVLPLRHSRFRAGSNR